MILHFFIFLDSLHSPLFFINSLSFFAPKRLTLTKNIEKYKQLWTKSAKSKDESCSLPNYLYNCKYKHKHATEPAHRVDFYFGPNLWNKWSIDGLLDQSIKQASKWVSEGVIDRANYLYLELEIELHSLPKGPYRDSMLAQRASEFEWMNEWTSERAHSIV